MEKSGIQSFSKEHAQLVASFVPTFRTFLLQKPRFNLKQVHVENCAYSDTALKSKNCYYCFGAFYCEDVYYGRYSRSCKDCSGIALCANCEGCVECSDCVDCYFCDYSENCRNCSECIFCHECYSCENCFGCVGLYQKKYCFFNEQLSQEEYQAWRKVVDLSDRAQLQQIADRRLALKKGVPLPASNQFRADNCLGNYLTESSECYYCFDGILLEDSFYTIEANANKNACDLTVCFETELCYSCVQSPLNYNCNFLLQVDQSFDCEFCAYSKNLRNCFGCVYLANKEFHILNQAVSPDLYPIIVQEIRKQLINTNLYNMKLFHVSDYEQYRLQTEPDFPIRIVDEEVTA